MKALILSAGVGKRLGDLTKDIPKCLLLIDSQTVLLDYSLQAIKDNGFTEVIFVTGHAEEQLKSHIDRNWKNKFSFKFIFNDKYADYNNIYSAYLARDLWDDETILFNSDIIFHPDILKNLLKKITPNVIARSESDEAISFRNKIASSPLEGAPRNDEDLKSYLVIHDKKILTAEDMKVKINENGEIKEINKALDLKSSYGEYIGITYLRDKERLEFLESLERNVKDKKLDIYYEDALADVLKDISVHVSSTEGLIWTEVDTKEDYELAKKISGEIKNINFVKS